MKLKKWNEFNEKKTNETEKTMLNEAMSKLQKEYREYFKFMLKCYDISSPAKLSDEKKKEFFKNIKKYWTKGQGVSKDFDVIEEEVCGKKDKK